MLLGSRSVGLWIALFMLQLASCALPNIHRDGGRDAAMPSPARDATMPSPARADATMPDDAGPDGYDPEWDPAKTFTPWISPCWLVLGLA
ncbi:MAG TPA: hypothetical protein VFN67_42185 [Polyangiales bacterium]|jgi:hypothetical protein|nr:hypothetical protein [Polyangiales bacterium]